MRHSTPPEAEQLLDIVRKLSRELRPGANGIDRLGLEHDLERDFGLDSLARVELLARIEREMGVRLADAAMVEAETPRDLLHQMGAASPAATPIPPPAVATAETAPEHPPETLATLIELLDWHVAKHGERVHITLIGEAEHSEDISYRLLQAEARALAAGLLAHGLGAGDRVTPNLNAGERVASGLSAGDRVAIMLPTGREFFAAFYGALYAGCVPVPLYPPARPSQIEDHMRRIAGIVANAEAMLLVTDERAKPLGHLLRAQSRCRCRPHRAQRTSLSCNTPRAAPAIPRGWCSPTPTCSPISTRWSAQRASAPKTSSCPGCRSITTWG
jgi:acyl carrier protein